MNNKPAIKNEMPGSVSDTDYIMTPMECCSLLQCSEAQLKRILKHADIPRSELPEVGTRFVRSSIIAWVKGRGRYNP